MEGKNNEDQLGEAELAFLVEGKSKKYNLQKPCALDLCVDLNI